MVEAIVSNNFMASPFQRYQGGIEASTGNLVQASGQMAALTANTIAGFGQNIAEGIKKYNQNAAENEILDGEAQALSQQIFGFQQMFADPQTGQINPEYAPFAESLTPDIQTLAKFNSMSLNQKKGVMTGMKARFANIGQNLAAFEMTKKARLQQDMNAARGGVREFDEQTVPTAIIPSGKLPYFYGKNYTEQEGELVRLAGEAKARGANVDLPSVLDNWRKGLKANAMSRPDLPPQIKEALVKQIDAGEGLTENIQTDESGVTDYAKEAEMYEKASTSVKEQLAPPKVEAPVNKGTAPVDAKAVEAESVKRRAGEELKKVNKLIEEADKNIAEDKDIPMGWMDKAAFAIESGLLDPINQKGFEEMARMYISQGRIKEVTPDNARMILNELNKDSMGGIAALGAIITPDPSAFGLGLIEKTRELSKAEKKALDGAFTEWRSKDRVKRIGETGDATKLREELLNRKQLLENQLSTGISAPKPADISKAQQAVKPAEAKPEPEYALTNQYNMALGTTTASVATSLESKRNDMKTFFQNKYGYVPASFEESFKAIYPEANFKTMETPYGAFMYDGKDWKQIQMQQPKVASRKEMAEEKAVSFGKLQPDSSIDVNEFGELVPNSGVYVRGIFGGTPTEAFKFRTQMLEASNAKKAVGRLVEINDMVGESLPWNSKVWGEAKALLPQIKAGLRTDIIGVGTVSNYEQQLIEEVVANPTLFWSLESSDRAKLAVIMDKISNRLAQEPANYGLEVKIAGKPNAEIERRLKMGNAGKTKLELDFEARGGKKGVNLNWNLANKIPDALKQ